MIKIIFLLLQFISFLCSAEEFKVALPMLPDVHPVTNQINSGNYIGSQLYYSLFDKVNSRTESFFLDMTKTKALDKFFRSYVLCLKSDVKFSDHTEVKVSDLIKSLNAFSAMYPQALSLESLTASDDKCAILKLKESAPGLFSKLTGMASTILKSGGDSEVYPTGVGPYVIKARSDNFLMVESTLNPKPRFDKISFSLIRKKDENVSKYSDINQLPPNSERDSKYDGVKMDAPSLKVYAMVLNILNSKERDTIRFLLEQEDWAKIFGLNLTSSKYFLPWLNTSYEIINKYQLKKPMKKIAFIVPDFYDVEKIERVLNQKQLSEFVYVKSLPAKDFAAWAFSGKEYIGLMGFDSSGSISSLEGDFSVYFESFFSKKQRIMTKPLKKIEKLITRSSNKSLSNQERLKIIIEAEKYLSDNDYLSPIGKVKRVFLYPSNVNVSQWHDFFSGIPRIDKIQ
jgi:hypothetical protein